MLVAVVTLMLVVVVVGFWLLATWIITGMPE